MLRNKKFLIIFDLTIGTLLLTALFYYVSSLPIEKSFLFAATLSAVLALAHIKGVGVAEEGRHETRIIELTFAEITIVIGAFLALYLAGLDFQAAVSGGLFFVILAEIYHSLQQREFPRPVMAVRRGLLFVSSAANCYSFVVQNAVLSILAGFFVTLVIELDRIANRKLLERNLISVEELKRAARLTVIAPSVGVGAIAGTIVFCLSTGLYDVGRLADDLRTTFRAFFLLVVIFVPIGSIASWVRLFLGGGKEMGEVMNK